MVTRKGNTKGGTAKSARSGASKVGALPPYGVAIRDALTRGDAGEMKRVAASARKYLREVGAAADKLDEALARTKS
ncbi:MAG TPA: DUF1843 domain-containing protein [Pyrinomonadaceae bacterium]|jgi:hypothetical protein